MERLTKSVDVKVDAADTGSITGYASTFTREPDWAGDVVAKGAFADWLKAYAESGSTLPLLYNHDQSLDSFIGRVTDIREDERGLLFTAEFDATEKAQRARELAMDGRLAKFSFAYVVREQGEIVLSCKRIQAHCPLTRADEKGPERPQIRHSREPRRPPRGGAPRLPAQTLAGPPEPLTRAAEKGPIRPTSRHSREARTLQVCGTHSRERRATHLSGTTPPGNACHMP